MASSPAPARAAAGHSRIATTSERNTKGARTRRRRNLIDILYSGASTSRQKRYAAEPAPDMANVPLIDERTANRPEIGLVTLCRADAFRFCGVLRWRACATGCRSQVSAGVAPVRW